MKKIFLTAALGFALLLPGCAANSSIQKSAVSADPNAAESQSTELFAMDTVMTLTAYGSHSQSALDAAADEIQRLDRLSSISSDSGDIQPLNENKSGQVSADTAALLTRALEVSESTGGIFDCTIAPVMETWGFPSGSYRVPTEDEHASLLEKVDFRQVQISGNT
ncbi:MAG: FAD:protein FMN transferase, partial [Butyricicoccus sp.]